MNFQTIPSNDTDIQILLDELHIDCQEERKRISSKVASILQWDIQDIYINCSHEIDNTLWRAVYLPRFKGMNMIYQDYVGLHQQKVSALIIQTLDYIQFFFPDIRIHYLKDLSDYHDVLEWVSPFWDIPTPIKLALSEKSQQTIDIVEDRLGQIFFYMRPLITFPEHTEEVLEDIIWKHSIESKVLSYFDKFEGFMTCIHELVAGNEDFYTPFENYIKIFQDIKSGKKLPEIQILLQNRERYLEDLQSRSHMYSPEVYSSIVQSSSIFDIDSMLEIADRVNEIFDKYSSTKSMQVNINNDLWIACYGYWKNAIRKMVLFNTSEWYWDSTKILCERWRKPKIHPLYQA